VRETGPMGIALVAALLGVLTPISGNGSPRLAPFDPASLRPTGSRLRLGEYHRNWSFSPDRTHLALGMGGAGETCGRGVCIVDARTVTIAGQIDTPTSVVAVGWLRPRRIVGVLSFGGVFVADPVTGAIVQHSELPFPADELRSARTPEGLAVLMSSRPARLVVTDAEGRVRIARLPGIRAGADMVVDRRARRAFVFAAGSPAMEVDLRTMGVRRHRVALPRRAGVPGRVTTSFREALWLGRGLVAVSGLDRVSRSGGIVPRTRSFPAGVRLVDTKTWTTRTVDRRAGSARLVAGRLLVHTAALDVSASRGVGLRIYTRDGRRLVRHLLGRQALEVEAARGRAYAYALRGRSRSLYVVHAQSGELIRRVAPPPRGYELELLDD